MKRALLFALLIYVGNNVNAQKKIETEGITSPTHQKYVNKIVFSSDFDPTLSKSGEVEANFKSEFSATSPIYFRAYFDNSIYNYLRPLVKGKAASDPYNYALGFNFYIDNSLLEKITANYDKEFPDVQKQTFTTYRGALKTLDIGKNLGREQFKEVLNNYAGLLSKGKHKIKVEIYPLFINPDNKEITKGSVIASGEFTLNAESGAVNSDDESSCLAKNVMNDIGLIKNIAQTLSKGNSFKVSPNDVRILTNAWIIDRNKITGVIERRRIEVLFGYKKTTDNKCYRANYTISQTYVGNRFTDELTYKHEGTIGLEMGEIDCKCLKQ
jgi:hypothetical protein